MSITLTVAASVFAALGGLVAWMYVRARGLRPAVYRNLGLTDLEPFLRSWGAWLGNRGVILVRHENADPTVQFRKHLYKRRQSVLVFRYRNADDSRGSFQVVRAALETARVSYELEPTRRTHQPRAIAVTLDPGDVFMPAAAASLIGTVFGALGAGTAPGFLVWCEGPIQATPDRDNVPLIPPSAAKRAGFGVGFALGRFARAVKLLRS